MDKSGRPNLSQFFAEAKHSETSSAPGILVTGKAPTPLATPQIPTPPDSHAGSGSPEQQSVAGANLVSISTTFDAMHHPAHADAILLSRDNVWFYIDTTKLLASSENSFNSLLPPVQGHASEPFGHMIVVPEPSIVLNIVLHAIYDISCAQYNPPFDAIAAAIMALKTYGIPLHAQLSPGTSLYSLLKSYAPLVSLDLYILAARHDLYDLAALASQYLHSLSLASLTDDIAFQMGAIYLKRLFFLHYGRIDALKRILLDPPRPHTQTQQCDSVQQQRLTRAWALASASLVWDAKADLSISAIESTLTPLEDDMTCDLCQVALKDRIKTLVVEWLNVNRTI